MLVKEGTSNLKKFYKEIYFNDNSTMELAYQEDMDYRYYIKMREDARTGELTSDDKLFLIRTVLAPICEDKKKLGKIILMEMGEDEEMHKLSEILIGEILKTCKKKRKQVSSLSTTL